MNSHVVKRGIVSDQDLPVGQFKSIERFSFECRKVIGFAFTTLRDWLKRFVPLFHLIRSTTKTNRDAFACIFPRFASATCNSSLIGSLYCLCSL